MISLVTILAMTVDVLVATTMVAPFDDAPAPWVPAKARDEGQLDRIQALAHFAAGRTYHQRGDFAKAMREYARADRLDPSATAARSNLVVAAIQEKQYPLAARYALKGIDPREAGDMVLGRLGIYLTEEGDLKDAIHFYEMALAAGHPKDDDVEPPASAAANAEEVSDIFTRLELGRLYHLSEQYAKAAEQLARVNEALEHPERFGINQRAKKLLLGNEPGESYQLFGEAFLMADRPAEAEAAFRKADSLASNAALLEFNLARIAFRRGHAPEALAGLQASLQRGLSNAGTVPYQLLSDVLKKLGKEGELLERLRKLHAAAPANAPLSLFLAQREYQAGRTEAAEALYAELSAAEAGRLPIASSPTAAWRKSIARAANTISYWPSWAES